jgi:hypothetical protein
VVPSKLAFGGGVEVASGVVRILPQEYLEGGGCQWTDHFFGLWKILTRSPRSVWISSSVIPVTKWKPRDNRLLFLLEVWQNGGDDKYLRCFQSPTARSGCDSLMFWSRMTLPAQPGGAEG